MQEYIASMSLTILVGDFQPRIAINACTYVDFA